MEKCIECIYFNIAIMEKEDTRCELGYKARDKDCKYKYCGYPEEDPFKDKGEKWDQNQRTWIVK